MRQKLNQLNNLPINDIDYNFIYMSEGLNKQFALDIINDYPDVQEPKIIRSFYYHQQKLDTCDNAERYFQNHKNNLNSFDDVYDKIFYIMKSGYFRKGSIEKTRFEENKEIFRRVLADKIKKGEVLEVVLPSFPFKLPNLMKVSRRSPDMAEILCLSRLYEICLTIERVYPPGLTFVIIADGQVYHKMFGVSLYEALHYRDQTISMIEKLKYSDKLRVVDMQDLVNSRLDEYQQYRECLSPIIETWWREKAGPRRLSLLTASVNNINNRSNIIYDLLQMSLRDLLSEFNGPRIFEALTHIRSRVLEKTEQAAFEYALFLYTLKKMNLIGECYPHAIRATVHPKPAQWGLHLVNDKSFLLPWQGVAYKKYTGQWRIQYEAIAIKNNAIPVHLENDMYPFYYEENK